MNVDLPVSSDNIGAEVPHVSIVMPVYNAISHLEVSIKSVLAQTFSGWELIVVDDCSTDGSDEVIFKFSILDSRIKCFKTARNSGVASARNLALEKAAGRYVAFLDSDDCWCAEKLEIQLDYAKSRSAAITYCSYDRVSESGDFLGTVYPVATARYKDMLYRNQIGNLTGMYDRHVLGKLRFRPVGHEDYLFWIEAVKKVGSAFLVPHSRPLATYLVRENSVSSNKFKAAQWQWENYRNNVGLGFWSSLYYFSNYAFSSVVLRLRLMLKKFSKRQL